MAVDAGRCVDEISATLDHEDYTRASLTIAQYGSLKQRISLVDKMSPADAETLVCGSRPELLLESIRWARSIDSGTNKVKREIVSEDQTPNGEDATETCPICRRPNSPGARDCCKHYVGGVWDGRVEWSEYFPAFEDAWNELSNFLDEENFSKRTLNELRSQMKNAGIPKNYLDAADPYDFSPSAALLKLVDFSFGTLIETDGMLSGAGYSLYHEDPKVILAAAEIYRNLSVLAKSILKTSKKTEK